MWRRQSNHERGEAEYLDDALLRIERDRALGDRAEKRLKKIAADEPLIADLLRTPQSPRHHAEGPFVSDHVRMMLAALYGILEEKLHLIDIEEFRRLKGYEGEIDELEETLKENAAFFETFALVHDAAKWATVFFTANPGTRGSTLGFTMDRSMHWEDVGASERAKMRNRYLELYGECARLHPREPSNLVQAQFFAAYGIDVHYPGHDHAISSPVYLDLLKRLSRSARLTDRDTALLEDMIVHHLDPIQDFDAVRPERIDRYVRLAQKHGFDLDDYLDVLQACVFLDGVCGSKRAGGEGVRHDGTLIVHFFQSEHGFAPWKRAAKAEQRALEEKRERNRLFRVVGLDGVALMELLNMQSSPEFGTVLKRIHAAVSGEGNMPALRQELVYEIKERVRRYHDIAVAQIRENR